MVLTISTVLKFKDKLVQKKKMDALNFILCLFLRSVHTKHDNYNYKDIIPKKL